MASYHNMRVDAWRRLSVDDVASMQASVSKRHSCKSEGLAACRKQCVRGNDASACLQAIELLEPGNGGTNYKERAKLSILACESGDAGHCTDYALLMTFAAEGKLLNAHAQGLLASACKIGHTRACFWSELNQEIPSSGPENWKDARSIFERYCSQGSSEACAELGNLFRLGLGGTKDAARAQAFYTQACKTLDESGCVEDWPDGCYHSVFVRHGAPIEDLKPQNAELAHATAALFSGRQSLEFVSSNVVCLRGDGTVLVHSDPDAAGQDNSLREYLKVRRELLMQQRYNAVLPERPNEVIGCVEIAISTRLQKSG